MTAAHQPGHMVIAFRAPASLGVADVIALKAGERPRLIEVKSTAQGPYERFGPADRARLRFAGELAGADVVARDVRGGRLTKLPPEGATCAGCGIPLTDGYVTGCKHCSDRRSTRLRRGELFTPTWYPGEMIDNRTGRIVASA